MPDTQSFPLRFDVPTLDALFSSPPLTSSRRMPRGAGFSRDIAMARVDLSSRSMRSLAISGPDGSGKSLLAMHLACAHWRTGFELFQRGLCKRQPLCIYVSTDFAYEQAKDAWTRFGLDRPYERLGLLHSNYLERVATINNNLWQRKLDLSQVLIDPASGGPAKKGDGLPLQDFFKSAKHQRDAIYFVDLQEQSAGDDWQFLNHLIGLLPRIDLSDIPNLIVIDAVEGLEVLVGRRDAFGEARSRRSRIAQLIRSAKRNNRSHLAFVIEEARPHRRLPEQFVTDMVIRLRQQKQRGYLMRSIEIEKCRGASHVRGPHLLTIRGGKGAFTGDYAHSDEPSISMGICDSQPLGDPTFHLTHPGPVVRDVAHPRKRASSSRHALCHLHVTESLHTWNAKIRGLAEKLPRSTHAPPTFSRLALMNELLGRLPPAENDTSIHRYPELGSVTLLLGDSATYKSRLGRHFLAEAFNITRPVPIRHAGSVINDDCGKGVAVLLTTGLLDKDILSDKLAAIVGDEWDEGDRERIFCRRLGVRFDTSAAVLATVRSYIRAARALMLRDYDATELKAVARSVGQDSIEACELDVTCPPHSGRPQRFINFRSKLSARIRLVIDDLAIYFGAHPNIRNDPMFLQSLIMMLKHEQVRGLIISTQPGQPTAEPTEANALALRQLDLRQILTWNVPFFGSNRVAITSLMHGVSRQPTSVFEIRGTQDGGDANAERVVLDRHFALYANIESGQPERVPLLVRLFSGFHETQSAPENATLYPRVIQHSLGQVFPARQANGVVQFEPITGYDTFAAFAEWLDDARLDHTLIFQIDEFWSGAAKRHHLLDLTTYFYQHEPDDPYGQFRPHPELQPESDTTRRATKQANDVKPVPVLPSWMRITSREAHEKRPGEGTPRHTFFFDESTREPQTGCDRVPYLWDFGFCLARQDLWYRAKDEPLITTLQTQRPKTVARIWNALCVDPGTDGFPAAYDAPVSHAKLPRREQSNSQTGEREYISWREFFDACHIVARVSNCRPFSVDTVTSESLLSLLFEMWASFDVEAAQVDSARPSTSTTGWLQRVSKGARPNLSYLLYRHLPPLYVAMVELASACGYLRAHRRVFLDEPPKTTSAAERHWYSTATVAIDKAAAVGEVHSALRLPGVCSTRGDWSLAVAAGSRSELLAHRALDMISSRQMGLLRMHSGVGLPVRDVLPDSQMHKALTALYRVNPKTLKPSPMPYGELCLLAPGADLVPRLKPFRRSWIAGYSADSFYFRRFVARAFEELDSWYLPELRHPQKRLLLVNGWRNDGVQPFSEGLDDRLAKAYRAFESLAQVAISAMGDRASGG